MIHIARLRLVSAGVLALALGLMAFNFAGAAPSDGVEVTVTPAVLSIVITNTPVDFPDTPLAGTANAPGDTTAPTITNNGSTEIGTLTAQYTNATEASCSGTGALDWQAVATTDTTPIADQIRMFADVSSAIRTNFIPQNQVATGDLFASTITTGNGVDLKLSLDMPSALGGTVPTGCSIALTVTGSA